MHKLMLATVCAALLGTGTLTAQTPLGRQEAELRAHLALQALDRYLETWNSRDPRRWAASLHFPHIRPGPGEFELSQTPEQYTAHVALHVTPELAKKLGDLAATTGHAPNELVQDGLVGSVEVLVALLETPGNRYDGRSPFGRTVHRPVPIQPPATLHIAIAFCPQTH